MPVSATHDDDLIYFDLIQVTKPSTVAENRGFSPEMERFAPSHSAFRPPIRAFAEPGSIEDARCLGMPVQKVSCPKPLHGVSRTKARDQRHLQIYATKN